MFASYAKTSLSHIRQEGRASVRTTQYGEQFNVRRSALEHNAIGKQIGSHHEEAPIKERYNEKYSPLRFDSSFGGHRHSTHLSHYKTQLSFRRHYASNANLPPHTPIGLPALSPTMEKGNIAKWRKKEGDKIKPGDVIAEVETDKATVDFECTEEGYLAKILYPEGSKDLNVNQVIAIMVENAADIPKFKDYKAEGAPSAPSQAPPTPAAPTPAQQQPQQPPQQQQQQQAAPQQPSAKVVPGAPPPPSTTLPKSGVKASPLAKSTASEEGVDIRALQGSGPGGRIIQADVVAGKQAAPQQFVRPTGAAPPAGAAYTDIPNTQIRRVIASRLTMSKQTIPHYYLSVDLNVDKLLQLRTQLNEKAQGQYKLSVNDFVVKASALALRKVPEANSSWTDEAIRRYHTVDINVAVNTDRGLFTPLLKEADKMGLAHINNTVKEMAQKAKDNKLSPAELQSGTFTISNLGMFGIKNFAAVINPPQACILAVGTSEKRVVVNENSKDSTNQFTTANFMGVTLSCDHRVVDGAIGAQWLAAFREYIEDPVKMLL